MHKQPKSELPYPLEGYGLPTTTENLLPWSYVLDRLNAARTYWISTIHPNGTPHVRPIWGVVVNEVLYVGGGSHTRWARNLTQNHNVSINLEDGKSAVIIEGFATYITDDIDLIAKTDAAYEEKYNIPHGPVWQITPRQVFAWHDILNTMTRWQFD